MKQKIEIEVPEGKKAVWANGAILTGFVLRNNYKSNERDKI